MKERERESIYNVKNPLFSQKIPYFYRRYEENDSFSSSFISKTAGKHSKYIHTCAHTCESSRLPRYPPLDTFSLQGCRHRRRRWGERSIRGNLDNDVSPFLVAPRETVKSQEEQEQEEEEEEEEKESNRK